MTAETVARRPGDAQAFAAVSQATPRFAESAAAAGRMSARALLTRVVARLPAAGPHILQFLWFERAAGQRVTQSFAATAAGLLGPVLQADWSAPDTDDLARAEPACPDAEIAGLYHGRLLACPLDIVRCGRSVLLRAAEAIGGPDPFAMVVLDASCQAAAFDTTTIAAAFSGTVLVATAGTTTLMQLRSASSTVRQAGGLVLGVVLTDVPSRPAWLGRWGFR